MSVIRVVWGTATGPTPTASYDAALAAANVHNLNLLTVSSVIPADPPLEVVGTAPDLGAVGDALTVVHGRATAAPGQTGAAGVGWARSESGKGIFYEADGDDAAAVRDRIDEGLAAGRQLRDWSFTDEDRVVREVTAPAAEHATAVVLATYGTARPLVR